MITRSLAAALLCALLIVPAAAQDFLAGARSGDVVMTRAGGECTASQYGVGDRYNGRRTASGEVFDTWSMHPHPTKPHPTGAHRTLPFGTFVTVTHLGNGRSVKVRINDRGPFVAGRCIDLSRAAANAIGMGGTARVHVEVAQCLTEHGVRMRMQNGERCK